MLIQDVKNELLDAKKDNKLVWVNINHKGEYKEGLILLGIRQDKIKTINTLGVVSRYPVNSIVNMYQGG